MNYKKILKLLKDKELPVYDIYYCENLPDHSNGGVVYELDDNWGEWCKVEDVVD